MESSLSTFLSGPGRYIAIICIAYLLIGLPLTMLYLKKNKIMANSPDVNDRSVFILIVAAMEPTLIPVT